MNLVYYVATSLDGYIATADGGVTWLDPFNDPDIDYGFDDFYAGIDGIVMGSATYEFSLDADEWIAPDKPSWVLTTRDLPVAHPNVTLTSDAPKAIVAAMAAAGVENAWLMGGGRTATAFREAGLITSYVVSFIPVILGGGIPLFSCGGSLETLALVEGKVFPNSVVMFEFGPPTDEDESGEEPDED